jgi:hypothetical protein
VLREPALLALRAAHGALGPAAPAAPPPAAQPGALHADADAGTRDATPSPSAPSPKPAAPRKLSPSWRNDAPVAELYVANFFRALQAGDEGGAAALLARAPGLANAARGGVPPLHAAVRVKSLPLAQLLVRAGADARAVDDAGRTAAAAAAADGAAGLAAWLEGAAARR